MANIVLFAPSTLIGKALFNFDAMGVGYSDFKLTGPINVSISSPFIYSQWLMGLGNNLTWSPDVSAIYWDSTKVSNVNSMLNMYESFIHVSFSNVIDLTSLTPYGASLTGRTDINIELIYRNDLMWSGMSSINQNDFSYYGSELDLAINTAQFGSFDYSFESSSFGFHTLMHELGHSLGLSHPHSSYNSSNGAVTITNDFKATTGVGFSNLGFVINSALDMNKEYFTIMSYDDQKPLVGADTFAQTPMILDVIALQEAYGAGGGTSSSGNDSITPGGGGGVNSYRTYFDSGGVDKIDLVNYGSGGAYLHMGSTIVGATHFVGVSMSAADEILMSNASSPQSLRWFYGEFEDASGSAGNDHIIGNALNNFIEGRDGNDLMTGGAGVDTFYFNANDNGIDTISDLSIGDSIKVGGANFSSPVITGNGSKTLLNQIQCNKSNGVTTLYIGTDAVSGSEIQISLTGNYGLDQFKPLGEVIQLAAHVNSLPTGSVTLEGVSTQGKTLSAINNISDLDGVGVISYQWKADDQVISGSNQSTLTLTQAHVGKKITAVLSYIDDLGTTETVVSEPSPSVNGVAAASYSTPASSIQSIGLSPDGNYFLIKVDGSTQTVTSGSYLEFNGSTYSTNELTQTITPIPVFRSSGATLGYALPDVYTGSSTLNLQYQLIETADNAVVVGGASNDFIKVSSTHSIGKAVDGGGGSDVIDGGVGSTFVSGGSGHTASTFFLDGRASGISWSTITDFKTGSDHATIWGWRPGISSIDVSFTDVNSGGATGYSGLTLHFKNLLAETADSLLNPDLNSITLSGHSLYEFGANNLADLNTQIIMGTNSHFIVGQTNDVFGEHSYLYIS